MPRTERAVFVLREVFDVGYDEIAAAVGKTPATVRQIAHRARRYVVPAALAKWSPPARRGRCWSRSSARWKPGTCRACSMCSPPRSS
ncbi:sigma factor-like helix-turn-helix DNA-binding protein [Streptosporangium canum]|uniref:sigma factor-like helix-turn-helix DNA-binding protein n=1 Tax=Streptosporangium canum TaxID=324952 RepID=UPI0036870380